MSIALKYPSNHLLFLFATLLLQVGLSALMTASEYGNAEVVDQLLQHNAQVDLLSYVSTSN